MLHVRLLQVNVKNHEFHRRIASREKESSTRVLLISRKSWRESRTPLYMGIRQSGQVWYTIYRQMLRTWPRRKTSIVVCSRWKLEMVTHFWVWFEEIPQGTHSNYENIQSFTFKWE